MDDTYTLIDTFKGRNSPSTNQPVCIFLWRQFDVKHLRDTYAVTLTSGGVDEVVSPLTPSAARAKFERLRRWYA